MISVFHEIAYICTALQSGVIDSNASITISNTNFTSNSARYGGVIIWIQLVTDSLTIINSVFLHNNATTTGGVLYCSKGTLNIVNSNFSSNTMNTLGTGTIFTSQCCTNIANSAFNDNVGSIYTFNSNLTFSGNSKCENSANYNICCRK